MTPQSLHRSSSIPLLRTSSDKAIDDIGKIEKGQTENVNNNSTTSISWNKKILPNSSMVFPNTKFRTVLIGQHRIKFYCKTCMVDRLTNLNAPNNITEHTIFTSNFQKSISTQFAKEVESLRNIVNSLDEKLKNETDSSQKIAIYDALKEINGFITRYQNTGLGGFDKVKASEIRTSELLFKNLPKDLHSQTQEYETIKKDFEDTEKKFQRLQKR